MKLRAVPYEVPYRRPIQTAHGTLTTRKGFWVLAEETGVFGIGEVAPLPEWGTERLADAQRALSSLPEFALPDASALGAALSALGLDRDRLPATAAGVEVACLDLVARLQGVSLATLLVPEGVSPLASLPANALLTAFDPEALAAEARLRVSEGFRTLKIKLGQGAIAVDAARVRAVREAVGEEIRLRGDANAAWDVETAVKALTHLQSFNLEYLEQPVPDASALASLRNLALVPVAADESAQDPGAVRRLIDERAVDWLILKPMALGGLGYTSRLAREAQEAGIGVTLTSVLDRGVGTAAALHLAAALGLSSASGLSNTHMEATYFVGPTPKNGRLSLQAPGHGVSQGLIPREVAHDA